MKRIGTIAAAMLLLAAQAPTPPDAAATARDAPAGREPATDGNGSRAVGLRGNPGQFFGPDEYPPDAMRKGEQGRVVASLAVDATGKVTDCRVVSSSGSTALDVKTCVIAVGRVTFTPARDERGRPIASRYTLPVRWVLPEQTLEARRSTDERFTVVLAADNRVESCRLVVDGHALADDNPFCRDWRGDGSGEMIRRMRMRTGPGRIALTLQRIVQFAGEPPIAEAHAATGSQVVGLRRAAIDILPDGSAANEQIVERAGPSSDPVDPVTTLGRYRPGPAATRITVLIAASWAPAR